MDKLPTKPRWKLFIEALPKHDWKVEPSAIEAGYSPSYAAKCQKQIMTSAMRAQANEALTYNTTNNPISSSEGKARLADFIGLNREQTGLLLKKIATQDRDYASALKVLAPIAKDLGHDITLEEKSTVVPMLNIVLEKGSTEPLIEDAQVLELETPLDL